MSHQQHTQRVLTDQQARSLKHQPDTGQGLRDQVLMCLLLNEKLPVKTISALRVTSFDREARVLVLPQGNEELPLTDETFHTLDRYVTQATPSVFLVQASASNGELSGGGVTPPALYIRVERLGAALHIQEKLTVEACYRYHDPSIMTPTPRPRSLPHVLQTSDSVAKDEVKNCQNRDDTPESGDVRLSSPTMGLDLLMSGLANLETCMEDIFRIQRGGNMTLQLNQLCMEADDLCASLHHDLTTLQTMVNLLPLHLVIVRLFPERDEGMHESFLLRLEGCAMTSLNESFNASLSLFRVEEQAYRVCERVAAETLGVERATHQSDLLKGIVTYASMYVLRKREYSQQRQHGLERREA